MERIGELTLNYQTPSILDIEWKIPHFTSLPYADHQYYSSPSFTFAGESWHLGIYPYLFAHISIAIEREHSGPPIDVHFSISFKNVTGEKACEEHRQCVFDEGRIKKGAHPVLRYGLLERSSEFLPSDILTVLCTVKLADSSENGGSEIDRDNKK